LAIYLGVYDKLLHSIGNIFKEFKSSVKFLIPIFLGIGLSVVGLAKIFSILIEWNSFIVLFFFIGLILGGVKDIYKTASKSKLTPASIIAFIIAFGIIIVMVIIEKTGNPTGIDYISITIPNLLIVFLVGMAASMTMIVPGVSGSALLLVLGFYTAIVSNVVGNILDFSNLVYNIQILIPFALGAAFGIILFSRVIEHCIKKYTSTTFYAILGFILASCIAIFFEIRDPSTAIDFTDQVPIYGNIFNYIGNNLLVFFGGIVTLILGFISTRLLSNIELKRK
jgi:putative membrane protein